MWCAVIIIACAVQFKLHPDLVLRPLVIQLFSW